MDWLMEKFRVLAQFLATWGTVFCVWLADAILQIGYPGIVFLMAVESSFIPFPSELVMPPAGYLIHEGVMSWAPVILSGVAGSIIGALVNYYLAAHFGRQFFLKYGRYVLLKPQHLERADAFFKKHGEITTFVGRLIPVIRQLISLPAGLTRMSVFRFALYTGLGSGIWLSVLTYIGYLVGANTLLLKKYLQTATLYVLALASFLIIAYCIKLKWFGKKGEGES